MSKKKDWTGSIGPDTIAAIITEANAHSSEFDIESILPPHIRKYFF